MGAAGPEPKIIAAVRHAVTVRRPPVPTLHELPQQAVSKSDVLMVTAATTIAFLPRAWGKPVQTLAHRGV